MTIESSSLTSLIPLVIAVIGGLVGYGELKRSAISSSKNIKELWKEKGSAEEIRKQETKIDGIDRWTRDHEDKANEVRREFGERFAQIEKSVEIGMSNHNEIVRLVTKLETLIEKMEKRFDDRLEKVEEAIDRRNNS